MKPHFNKNLQESTGWLNDFHLGCCDHSKGSFFQQCWENWSSASKRMKLDPYLPPETINNSKWIRNLHVKSKSIELSEESVGRRFYDIGFGDHFLARALKAQATEENR